MNYWLLKSEPDSFSIDDLAAAPKRTAAGTGFAIFRRATCFGLHEEGRSGVFLSFELRAARHCRNRQRGQGSYPDKTADDPSHHHYDANNRASGGLAGTWSM